MEEFEEETLGEGSVNLEEEEPAVEEESILTEYDADDFVSGAVTSLDATIPDNLFDFEYCYGYNCAKYFNLCACDDSVVCWSAGSMITFMDVNTKQNWFRRSTTGGTVGCITSYRKDPNYRIAVAEAAEGINEPIILLYTWPQMEIDAVLRDGTLNAYSILDFSPEGDLLVSIGKEPDYNITIWNWQRHRILLRTSAFTFDVNAVMFSPYCPGQLTTAGAAHIKFWKMARTFTGLKLKGELGRFGKTEICDVLGVYPMPDEKVLSGCEWGNILVWEAGLVKVEVTRRGRRNCHEAPIIQFMLMETGAEVVTIARDGCIRAWYWDTVEQADPPEDDPYVELNPVAETCVPGCQIMCLKHQKEKYWYAQDGNGGIWTVDLEIDKIQCNHQKVMTSHAGGVVAVVPLRAHPVLLTAGADGVLLAYNTRTHALLAKYQFDAPITCVLYPPPDVDSTSSILVVGYANGVLRTLLLSPELLQERTTTLEVLVDSSLSIHSEESVELDVVNLISLLKPHSKAIKQISINDPRTILVTCGEDSTIFMYRLEQGTPFQLHRLGFIDTPCNIEYMTWKPNEELVLLMCGEMGLMLEAVLPDVKVREYTDLTTFKLDFVSYRELLVKKHFIRNRPFPTEEDLASLDEEALKAAAEAEKDMDDEEEEWLGEIQLIEDESAASTITWAQYCEEGIWAAQSGTGALLLLRPGSKSILKYAPIPRAWCDSLTTIKFVCENRYLVVGTNRGYIHVVRIPTGEEDSAEHHYMTWMIAQQKLKKKLKGRRLAKEEPQPTPRLDFFDNYYLPMHDSYTGSITCLEFSSDGKYLYSSGCDGNIFSYVINFPEPLIPTSPVSPKQIPKIKKLREPSTIDGELLSHEQLKQKEEYDKMMAEANAHMKQMREELAELAAQYNKIIKANKNLPWSQQVDITLDPRPLLAQEQELEEAKALTRRKLAHQLQVSDLALHKMYSRNIVQLDVFPFTLVSISDPEIVIRPLRQKNLSKSFYDQLSEVHEKMAEAALLGRRAESISRKTIARKASYGPPRVASFLLGLPPHPPHPLKKALRNYHQRMNRHHVQFIEWQEHLNRKPDPNAPPPGAAEALKEAQNTIGNKLLKTQPDYVAPPGHNTQLKVCFTRKEIYDNKHEFNEKLLRLRDHKVRLVAKIKEIRERLVEIHGEIPPQSVKPLPATPHIDDELEFPEKNLEIKPVKMETPIRSWSGRKSTERKTPALAHPQPRTILPRVAKFVPITDSKPHVASWELLKERPGEESTAIEKEIRERRIKRHLYEQDMLLADAQKSLQQFDALLRHLQRERIRVQEKNQLLELHLYQLHREMNVLNRFEASEDRLAERVYQKLMQVRGVQDLIDECETRIEELQSERENTGVECQELQVLFKKLVQDNKFADFLRRIFKKKYRPPRDRDDDEESSESESSSSSEEEEEGSVDSRDIGPIRLDPNVCPEGCDVGVYNRTYELRNTRHKYEQQMMEYEHMVDVLRKDIEAHNKVKKKFAVQLEHRKSELKEFMMEKQSCMNEVDQVVVLRYHQVRASALRGCASAEGLANVVVFPEQMLTRLRKRVHELKDEIKQQKERQKVNRTHVFRMQVDMRAMEESARALSASIRAVLVRKLGYQFGHARTAERSLDELLRQLARQHKYRAVRASMPPLRLQLAGWKQRYSELEKSYLELLNRFSDRLRLAAALQADVLPDKPARDATIITGGYEPQQYARDVVRLRIVRAQQLEQIQVLEIEIEGLRLKPLSPMPVRQVAKAPPEPEFHQLPPMKPIGLHRHPKYFPISPLGSQLNLLCDVHVTARLHECVDALRVSRDDAPQLLHELTMQLPAVIAGTKSRFEVVDKLVRKWLYKYGGDPSLYKKHTRAFDALASLADKMIRQHIEAMEGTDSKSHEAMESMEKALQNLAGDQPLHEKLGPALGALILSTEPAKITCEDAMTSLVNSLVGDQPVTAELLDKVTVPSIIHDIKACGICGSDEDLTRIVELAVKCIRAQLVTPEEREQLDSDVEKAFRVDISLIPAEKSEKAEKSSPGADQGDKTDEE